MKNEEDVKFKVVYPFLEDLGILKDEVVFENKFEFRLGTNVFKVRGKDKKKALGFSDILCRKDDQNLFIIEVKDSTIVISQDDIDQAISYARLVNPIAPFSIVTNGIETKVYDTITKKDLTGTKISESSDYWANGLKLSLEEELRQRFLAIQSFIGYSEENTVAFSQSQVNARISTLKGDKRNLHKKYISELYLSIPYLENQFEQFILGNSQLFPIIGESGVGKSNAVCYLTERHLNKHVVFFFNGSELTKSILHSIKEDCNWFFSPTLEEEEVLSKLLYLTNDERKLLIFIDAIDEIIATNINLELNELARRIKKYPNIKICISCKSNEWQNFLSIKGNPSSIIDVIYNPTDIEGIAVKEPEHKKLNYGIELLRFNNDEIEKLDILYRNIYGYKGTLNNEVKNELRLGFTLRTFATVFENIEVPKNLNDAKLFEEYLKKTLDKLDYEKATNYLIEIARAIYEVNHTRDRNNTSPGFVEEQILRKQLKLSINEKIYPELFSYNILSRNTVDGSSSCIGFYYGRLRNFILATKVLKLQTLNDDEFRAIINELIGNTIGQETLLWYYHSSIFKHHTIIRDFYLGNALIFISTYEEIINNHFYQIKDKFDPYTKSRIGLVIADSISEGLKSYALYPVASELDEPLKVLKEKGMLDLGNLVRDFNGHILRSDRDGFLILDPQKKAKELIYEQLKEIVKKGELSEERNKGILKEKVLAIVHQYNKDLGYDIEAKGYFTINFNNDFCINLDDVLKKIKYKYAQRYYEELAVQDLIRSGDIPTKKMGDYISYTINRTLLDFNSINQKAKNAVEMDIPIPESNISGNVPPYKALKKSILSLKSYCSEISELLLPMPTLNKDEVYQNLISRGGNSGYIPDLIMAQFNDEDMALYTKAFFELFLKEYKIFVEHNFVGLEKKFQLFFNLPVHIHCEINSKGGWSLIYGIKKTTDSSMVSVEINSPKSIWGERDLGYYTVHGSTFESIIRNSQTVPIDKNISFEKASELCAIRNFLYRWIADELNRNDIFN